ncbi:MAG: quinolinate synthase NadA [Brockia lithotrophica]|nr:quinolinate synthase NadA [Brockia lithotrophica]
MPPVSPHTSKIAALRESLRGRVALLAHQYVLPELARLADAVGDSLELARLAAERPEREILLLGVRFMAESAALLAGENKRVYAPVPAAGCALAEAVRADALARALEELARRGREIVPVAYANTDVAVKAVVGRRGGAVATSANAVVVVRSFLERGKTVLFLPDENLGRVVAWSLGLREEEVRLWGEAPVEDPRTRLFLWPGACPVHAALEAEDLRRRKKSEPHARFLVHPECPLPAVREADAWGSTRRIQDYVESLPPGTRVYVGTEERMVRRLAEDHPELDVRPLLPRESGVCPYFSALTPERVAEALRAIAEGRGEAYEVRIPPELASDARRAVERMVALTNAATSRGWRGAPQKTP